MSLNNDQYHVGVYMVLQLYYEHGTIMLVPCTLLPSCQEMLLEGTRCQSPSTGTSAPACAATVILRTPHQLVRFSSLRFQKILLEAALSSVCAKSLGIVGPVGVPLF